MLFDSHAHFPMDPIQRAALLQRAVAAGVGRILAIGGAPDLNQSALSVAGEVSWVKAAVGMDRTTAQGRPDEVRDHVAEITTLIDGHRERVVAVGELGLDYHYDSDCPRSAQQALFHEMLAVARQLELPVVVHCREAATDVVAALTDHAARCPSSLSGRVGVLHCFTETTEVARALVEAGYFISFSGIITFKNAAALRDVVPTVPDEHVLIETDTPYLAPVPHRGKPNEPAFVSDVAAQIATLRGMSPAAVAELTARNASRLFGF